MKQKKVTLNQTQNEADKVTSNNNHLNETRIRREGNQQARMAPATPSKLTPTALTINQDSRSPARTRTYLCVISAKDNQTLSSSIVFPGALISVPGTTIEDESAN